MSEAANVLCTKHRVCSVNPLAAAWRPSHTHNLCGSPNHTLGAAGDCCNTGRQRMHMHVHMGRWRYAKTCTCPIPYVAHCVGLQRTQCAGCHASSYKVQYCTTQHGSQQSCNVAITRHSEMVVAHLAKVHWPPPCTLTRAASQGRRTPRALRGKRGMMRRCHR